MRIGGMRTFAIGMVVATSLVACGDDGTSTPAPAATESPSAEESPPAEAAATIELADSDLGSILVDADGVTLYLFEADADGTSTCYDDCAEAWPALIDDAPTVGDGLDAALLDTTARDDGEIQVTYAGHPLYYFAADTGPGDTQGQRVGDVWFVVDAEGSAVK